VKARAVSRDPFERTGERAVLNLGHTVGHALETASGHRLQHGEAVAWGLLAALRVSVARAGLAAETADALARRILRLVSPPVPSPAAVRGMPVLLAGDKKADRAGLNAVLLAGPGRPTLARVERAELAEAFEEALGRYNKVGWVLPGFRA
jgi:3-dehydroquinate synthetase